MSLSVISGDPRDPRTVRLLQSSHALMQELFPAESNHYLSIDALCEPSIRFFVAQEHGTYYGCAALALKSDYGEIKSMFVDQSARGKGVGDLLMNALFKAGQAENLLTLRLETGSLLPAAHKLYERHGFSYREAFGDYQDDPLSLFMERTP